MSADYRLTFATEQVAKKNVTWLTRLVEANLCHDCREEMSIDLPEGTMMVRAHCGWKIDMLWRLVRWSKEVDDSPRSLLRYYDKEDLS